MKILEIIGIGLFAGGFLFFAVSQIIVEERVKELKEDFRRLLSIRLEGAETERRLHDIDREAFEAMIAEAVLRTEREQRRRVGRTARDASTTDGRS